MTIQMSDIGNISLDSKRIKAIRRHLHQIPEIGLEEIHTSQFIADHLSKLGYSVHRGLAETCVVGTLKNGSSGRSLGIRADMDGLPMTEQTGRPYTSKHPGRMHACGHDGHVAMLLGAAEAIIQRRLFNGTIHLIFQPAEENVGGAGIMVEEGLFEKFPCDAVFALHNDPSLPLGQIALRDGPIMAAVDEVLITVHGRGGHGASPEDTADPIVAGAAIVMALQTIVSRNIDACDPAVVTVGSFHGGTASNIIPNEVELVAGIRSFAPDVRDYLQKRVTDICQYQALSYGVTADVDYRKSYDATINHTKETQWLKDLASAYLGGKNVLPQAQPLMGSEDFTYMLQACPGCMFFIGTGASDYYPLHHPKYDFNDDILHVGAGFWTYLTESFLA